VATNFTRARSFGALRGFARVGGVLIGQDPAERDAAPMNFRDLRWEADGPNLRLLLIDANGQVLRSRPFRKTLIYHALTYAADGRPLAVTMVTAKPLPELRILLHPTLVDTAVGYRVVELDRFVDQFTHGNDFPQRLQAEVEVYGQADLYRLARAQRLLALVVYLRGLTAFKVNEKLLTQIETEARDSLENPRLKATAALVLKNPGLLRDGQRSPLAIKKEFFDPDLVQLIIESAQPGDQLGVFLARLKEQAGQRFSGRLLWDPTKEQLERLIRRCLSPAPEFQVWSGVRERAYAAQPEVLLPGDSAAPELPLRFMLQVAFTSPPYFLGDDPKEEQLDGYSDLSPWEFPALRDGIQKRVLEGVATDPRAKAVLDDAAEFTLLQRLFRVALLGNLGKDFPVERLVALTDATAPAKGAPRTVRTPRWNSGGGLRALAQEKGQAEELKALVERIEKLPDGQKDGPVAEGLEALRACHALLEERARKAEQVIEGLKPLLDREEGKAGDAQALPKCRELYDGWQHFQEDWLKRWAGKCDLGRYAPKAAAEAEDESRPAATPGAQALQRAVQAVELINLVLRLRQQLGLQADDRQGLEELLQSRPLPPL
jgi:hypothetical protein